MKFSYNWLRELVDGLDTSAHDLERLITIKTAECEGVEEVGAALATACEATVLSAEPMGKGHNQKTVVETANYGRKTVVCGAPNCRVGLRTVYVPLGKKDHRRSRKRRHARQRGRVGHQPRSCRRAGT